MAINYPNFNILKLYLNHISIISQILNSHSHLSYIGISENENKKIENKKSEKSV